MSRTIDQWMAYINDEVRTVCETKKWGYRIRRKWSAREKPVKPSSIDDYEWKLIPESAGLSPTIEDGRSFEEGRYYVLGIDTAGGAFIFQHSTNHCGVWGRHWNMTTFTRISFDIMDHPPGPVPDRLRDYLLELIARFEPNHFSIT